MRLFVGVPIPEELRKRCALLQKELPRQLRFVSVEQLHFTLKFLDEQQDAEPIVKILDKVALRHQAFAVKLHGVGAFPGQQQPRVVWIGTKSSALVALAEDVQKKLADSRKEDHQSVVPHVTIARVSDNVKFDIDKWKDASFGEFLVSSFVLYESVLTSQGSLYRIVKEFGLVL